MVDPGHFDARSATYASARPPYPDALWGRVRALDAWRPGAAALDLGAGTGQATGPLLAGGCVEGALSSELSVPPKFCTMISVE